MLKHLIPWYMAGTTFLHFGKYAAEISYPEITDWLKATLTLCPLSPSHYTCMLKVNAGMCEREVAKILEGVISHFEIPSSYSVVVRTTVHVKDDLLQTLRDKKNSQKSLCQISVLCAEINTEIIFSNFGLQTKIIDAMMELNLCFHYI
ncbi:unnamed protein product [Nippostrongylus brasiliensis]|uniref:AsnC_trans_reg domain-containing protein n=1 Tax=Nippostrongylus brasiliensis TaxID=27835 RepID=A0A0N4YWZ7_NIPBR|nr:unnamed protein product [Nippostrongylus brasiliensis]